MLKGTEFSVIKEYLEILLDELENLDPIELDDALLHLRELAEILSRGGRRGPEPTSFRLALMRLGTVSFDHLIQRK